MGGEPTFISIDDFEARGMERLGGRPDQARARRRSDPKAARALRARRLPALRPGQMVSGREPAALGLRALLAQRRRADLARPRARRAAGQTRENGQGRPKPSATRRGGGSIRRTRWPGGSASTVLRHPRLSKTRCTGCRKEAALPINIDPSDPKIDDPEERGRIIRDIRTRPFDPHGLRAADPALERAGGAHGLGVRTLAPAARKAVSAPGDSPVGLRLPLKSLPWVRPEIYPHIVQQDPLDERPNCRRPLIISSPTAAAPRPRRVAAGGAGARSRRRRRAHRADRRAARRRALRVHAAGGKARRLSRTARRRGAHGRARPACPCISRVTSRRSIRASTSSR